MTNTTSFGISVFISLALFAFWAWMLWDFVNNSTISEQARFYWFLAFLFLGALTAGYYYFTVYTEKN